MKLYFLPAVFFAFSFGTATDNCSQNSFATDSNVKGAISRLLSEPAYSGWDEKTLNRSGDLAASIILKMVPSDQIASPRTARQILLILSLAFAAPQLIEDPSNRKPTESTILLDRLEKSDFSKNQPNAVGNVRREVEHNSSTGRPFEIVSLADEPTYNAEHTQWIGSVLQSISDIKPGMTRRDLLKVFATEGGLSTPTRRTFALRGCPNIKVDVEFSVSDEQDRVLDGNPNDKIMKLSKPYLDYPHYD